MQQIRNKVALYTMLPLTLIACFGIYLTNNSGIFYNIILMPFIGAVSYIILKDQWFITPIGVFVLSYIMLLITYLIENHAFSLEILSYPFSLTIIYTLLVFLGIFIGALLKFAFKKEKLNQ